MISLGIYAIAAVGLVAAVAFGVHQIKESGREACRAEHIEAARMAELRSRERVDIAAERFQQNIAQQRSRERALAPKVASAVASVTGGCLSDSMLHILTDDISQHGTPSEPKRALSPASSPD